MKKTRKVAEYGLTVALALILSYLESLIPPFFAIPGIKLGLTNIVVLYALYAMDAKSALFISGVRILLVGILFGNGASILYSLAGGLLSWAVMVVMKNVFHFRMVTVSVAGGVFHNVGQILMAMLLMQTKSIAWYLLILWFSGIASGVAIGIMSQLVVNRVQRKKAD